MKPRTSSSGLALFALLLIWATVPATGADRYKTYGAPLSGTDTTPLAKLIDRSADYEGKTVRVRGTVTDVCEMAGCWMTLVADPDASIQIKVADGEIVFPVEARGRRAIAEGTFSKIAMSLEETRAYARHRAEEQGHDFDPDDVTEPRTFYRIQAVGARIF